MFPYVELITWKVGRYQFPVFLTLVIVAVAVAAVMIVMRGRRRFQLPAVRLEEMCLWVVVVGFTAAHLFSALYQPDPLAALTIPGGVSSFGGFFGGLAAIWFFFLRHGVRAEERWKYLDTACYALPFSWIFGRMGCALVHDHPGIRTTTWLGVRFPGGIRYDLGLLEVLFLAVLGAAFLAMDRRPRVPGFFFVAFFAPYGVFRLVIDQLHVDPRRYFGITVDQYAASTALLVAAAAWIWVARREV